MVRSALIPLHDEGGVAIDLKDAAPWPISADGLGASVERACWGDALNQPSQWIGSPLGLPSPGQANHLSDCPPPVSGGIVIAEVLYHPTIEEMDPSLLEFIKLQNITDHTIDCSGWILAGSLFHILGPPISIFIEIPPVNVRMLRKKGELPQFPK